jgi:hypothetical protein
MDEEEGSGSAEEEEEERSNYDGDGGRVECENVLPDDECEEGDPAIE